MSIELHFAESYISERYLKSESEMTIIKSIQPTFDSMQNAANRHSTYTNALLYDVRRFLNDRVYSNKSHEHQKISTPM